MTTRNQLVSMIYGHFESLSLGRTNREKAGLQREADAARDDLDAIFEALQAADHMRVACSVGCGSPGMLAQAAYDYDAKRAKTKKD